MSDSGAEGQEPSATPPEGTDPSTPDPEGGSTVPEGEAAPGAEVDQGSTVEATEGKETQDAKYEALRKEAAANRRRAKAAEEKLRLREEAELSEKERADKRAQEAEARALAAETRARDARLEVAVTNAATALRFEKAPQALAILKAEKLDRVTFDEETGIPENVEELVKEIGTENPNLIRPATTPSSTGAPASDSDRGETDEDRYRRIFGGQRGAPAFSGGGVVTPPRE